MDRTPVTPYQRRLQEFTLTRIAYVAALGQMAHRGMITEPWKIDLLGKTASSLYQDAFALGVEREASQLLGLDL